MARFLRTVVLAGLVFGTCFGVPAGILALVFTQRVGFALAVAAVCVVGAGLPFGFALAAFQRSLRGRAAGGNPDLRGEHVLWEGVANHFVEGEGVGGYMWLTDSRLLFVSHRANVRPHELTIPLHEVREVRAARTLRLVPNALNVDTASDTTERFVVEDRGAWAREIQHARGSAGGPDGGASG